MPKEYKIVENVNPMPVQTDDNKIIEVTESVPQVKRFTIAQLKAEKTQNLVQIERIQTRNTAIDAEIAEAKLELGLK